MDVSASLIYRQLHPNLFQKKNTKVITNYINLIFIGLSLSRFYIPISSYFHNLVTLKKHYY